MKYIKSLNIILLLAAIGIILSIKLLLLDYNILFSENYIPECDISQKINCSVVAQSNYAFLFKIPVASIGLLAYILILIYMVINRKKNILFSLLIIYSVLSVGSMYYFGISKFKLNAICIYCTGTYIINWLSTIILLFVNIKYQKEKTSMDNFKPEYGISLFSSPIYILICLIILIPSFFIFEHQSETKASPQPSAYPNEKFDTQTMTATAGSDAPKVTIVLYSDYECPYCNKYEDLIKEILTNFKDVKLIRKEFPLDMACNPLLAKRQLHQYACNAAYFAKCAGIQNKFWQACDKLHFNHEHLNNQDLLKYAKELDININDLNSCMTSKQTLEAVENDIKEGLALKITGTPGYLINGDKYSGVPKYEVLEKAIIYYGGTLISPLPQK